jgi:hypothetical protein
LDLLNAPVQLQQWNNLVHVRNTSRFMVMWSSSLICCCSAATILNLQWHCNCYWHYIPRYAWAAVMAPAEGGFSWPSTLPTWWGHHHIFTWSWERAFLDNQLLESWIGHGELTPWLPRSPELSPLDFFSRVSSRTASTDHQCHSPCQSYKARPQMRLLK